MTPLDEGRQSLVETAKAVLTANWRDGYTVPHEALYPFQWLWDSGFIALGYSHFDLDRAQRELRSLFKGLWKNGLLPHIVFHRDDPGYFPGPDVWNVAVSPDAVTTVPTSGITQPPVVGFVLEMMLDRVREPDVLLPFVDEVYDDVLRVHRYLYAHRDPNDEGLIYIQHPWESGADNSPLWDGALAAVVPDESVADVQRRRRDITHVAPGERPSPGEYERYMQLVALFEDCRYSDECIAERSPFLVQDALFNSILIRSNTALVGLGRLLGKEVEEIEAWNVATRTAMNDRLWSSNGSAYDSFDVRAGRRMAGDTALGLVGPLFAGVPDQRRADMMVDVLRDRFVRPEYYACPTVSPDASTFDPMRYWRGPVWINTNWMLYHGLRDYGYHDLAARVRRDTIDLIGKFGFREYFSPSRDEPAGLGARRFSWSAALLLDLILADEAD